MTKLSIKSLCAVMISTLALSAHLSAQTFTGDVVGRVTDPSGAPASNVDLTLVNTGTNAKFAARTDADGNFIFARIAPGSFELTASATGFKRAVVPDVKLLVGSRLTVDVQLQVGDVSTSIEVSAASKLIQTDDVIVGQVIQHDSIVSLPLNGRNFIQLAQLSPGVTEVGPANSATSSWTGRGNLNIVVSGLRETDTSYLLDGVETRSPRWGNSGFRPSIDAIEEFNLQRSAFTADQGWGTSVVNTILRSGTNGFHGSVFEFLRNDKLDARNFFDVGAKPPFKQNQFGYTFGGPIVKNKVFFFTNYEGFRQRLTNTYQGRVPTPDQLQGRFTSTVTDPLTGQAFPNNTIPASRFDPVAKNVIKYWPTPNRPQDAGLNYYRSAARSEDSDQFHAKVDFRPSSTDSVFVRYSYLDNPLLEPSLIAGFGQGRPLGDQNAVVSYTRVFGPRVINEFRVGYNRDRNFNTNEGAYGPDVAAQIGLKNTNINPANFGLPLFAPNNYAGVGQGFAATLATVDQLFQFNDSVSLHFGKHDVKVGADVRWDRMAFTGDFPSNPYFFFNGDYTGNAIGDFLLGLPNNYLDSNGSSQSHFYRTSISFFAQDNWKLTPKLTLNVGLRHEYEPPYRERNNRQSYFDFSTRKLITVQDGARATLQKPEYLNFAPRFGFAYSAFSNTVVRGGFGIYYDLTAANEVQFRGILNPPVFQIISANNTTPKPSFSLQNLFPALPFSQTDSPQTTIISDRRPYVYQYDFNVQQQIHRTLLEVGYVGSTGHRLNRRFNNNLAAPGAGALSSRRPFQGFSDILTSQNDGWSDYNGLNVKVEKRAANGLTLLGAYTWGKALDIGGSDEYVHRDITGTLKDLRGPAQLDTRQRLVVSYVYELPIGKGKPLLGSVSGVQDKFISGWKTTGVAAFNTGHPLTPLVSSDWADIGARRLQPLNRIGPGNSDTLKSDIRNQPTLFPYFRVQDFQLQPKGTIGNGGRGTIIGPGVNNWDLGLLKDTAITERVRSEFRFELFNAFNHAQFSNLDVDILSPTFGRITGARAPRDLQFSVKILF